MVLVTYVSPPEPEESREEDVDDDGTMIVQRSWTEGGMGYYNYNTTNGSRYGPWSWGSLNHLANTSNASSSHCASSSSRRYRSLSSDEWHDDRDYDEYEYEGDDDGGIMCNMRDYWTGVESYYYQDDDDGDDNDVEEEETTAKFVENRCGMEGACRPGTSSIRTTRYYARRTNPRWSTSRTSNRRPWT